jgi:hypothetical protein
MEGALRRRLTAHDFTDGHPGVDDAAVSNRLARKGDSW